MTLQTDIEAAQAKVDADNAQLASDTAARDAIQAQIDAAAPHLTRLQEIEVSIEAFAEEIKADFVAAIANARAKLGF